MLLLGGMSGFEKKTWRIVVSQEGTVASITLPMP